MRTWVYNQVVNMDDLDDAFKASGHVISSGAADSPLAPFLVVSMGVEQPFLGMPRSAQVQEIPFTIWVHDTPGSMMRIDDACIALKNNLPADVSFMVGGMSVFGVRWDLTGEDSYDDHFKTNCRPVRFSMPTRH